MTDQKAVLVKATRIPPRVYWFDRTGPRHDAGLGHADAGSRPLSTYNWETEQASVPVNLLVSKVSRVGQQMIQFGGGLRYWADSPDSGPEGWGLRLNLVLLYPR